MDIVIKVRFDKKYLAGEDYEKSPQLQFWTSAHETFFATLPLDWSDAESALSMQKQISIPIGDPASLRIDDTIRVACTVLTQNQDNKWLRTKAGSACFFIKGLLEHQKKTQAGKGFSFKRELRMATCMDQNGKNLLKGVVHLELVNHQEVCRTNWKFTSHPYALECNPREPLDVGPNEKLTKIIMYFALRNHLPYQQVESEDGTDAVATKPKFDLPLKPIDETVSSMHCPIYMTEVGPLPTQLYSVTYTQPKEHDEAFYLNLARTALSRYRMAEDVFITAVDEQYSNETGSDFSDQFFQAVVIMADACCILSTMMPYIGDMTYVSRAGAEKGKRISIESFNDMLRFRADDCEGSAQLIHRISFGFKYGRGEFANPQVPHQAHGSWKSPLLQRFQRIAHSYVRFQSLGSVVGAYIGQKKKLREPPVIGSPEDTKIRPGGHMWHEMVPVGKTETLMKKTNPDHPFKLQAGKKEKRPPWEEKLPILVGEGTGYLYPLIKPLGDYFQDDSKRRAEYTEKQRLRVLGTAYIDKLSETLKLGMIQRQQKMLIYDANRRLTTFYREQVHAYTDDTLMEGYPISQMTWLQFGGRMEDSKATVSSVQLGNQLDFSPQHAIWNYGVSMRDRHYDKPNLGLLVATGYDVHELHAIRTLLRQMPPQEKPIYEEPAPEFCEKVRTACTNFQEEAKKIIAAASDRNTESRATYVNVYVRADAFTDPAINSLLLKDIENLKAIVEVQCFFDVIMKDIHTVRIALDISTLVDTEEVKTAIKEAEERLLQKEATAAAQQEEGSDDSVDKRLLFFSSAAYTGTGDDFASPTRYFDPFDSKVENNCCEPGESGPHTVTVSWTFLDSTTKTEKVTLESRDEAEAFASGVNLSDLVIRISNERVRDAYQRGLDMTEELGWLESAPVIAAVH